MNLLQKWAERVTPEPFREFIPYVSPSSLHVVHANEVLKLAVEIGRNAFSRTTPDAILRRFSDGLRAKLGVAGVDLAAEAPASAQPIDVTALDAAAKREIGSRILALYFTLVHEATYLPLDLRLKQFRWDATADRLYFIPTSFGFEPSTALLTGLGGLYRGFYLHDEDGARAGLSLYAWKSKAKEGYFDRIEGLLKKHFGSAEDSDVSFSMPHFRSSFHAIFEEAKASDAKLHPELAFVGSLLVTLYLALSELGQAYPVSSIYHRYLATAEAPPRAGLRTESATDPDSIDVIAGRGNAR